MNFSTQIKRLRSENNLTGEQLGNLLGITKTGISYWESGKSVPNDEMLVKIANHFNVTVDHLLGNSKHTIDSVKGFKIPVIGSVIAGVPIEAVEEILDYEEIDEKLAKTGKFFGLKIRGNSMEPRIYENDVVIVKQQSHIETGQLAIVLVNGHEATVKQVKKLENGIMLIPFNTSEYEPMFYDIDQIDKLPVTIIGRVIELRGKF